MCRLTLFLCFQAFLLNQALAGPVLQLGNNLVLPGNLQVAGNQQCLTNNVIIEPCSQVVTEVVPSLQCGDVSVTGDLPIGGTIRVTGCFPVYGVVAVDGAVPSAGTGYVNHACGCS
ncbi:uncharacterized protein LOC134676828 [Cydia fagiglandana]|uniref:uncharacterized protein LOC134676828 n=1 Tax=Cydia fagiglandana TaxID=1458189 RepID=UPI002FEE5F6E